jgi:hypothetical protein
MPTTGIAASIAMRARTDIAVLKRINRRPVRETESATGERTISFSGQRNDRRSTVIAAYAGE